MGNVPVEARDDMVRYGGAPTRAEHGSKGGLWPNCEVQFVISHSVGTGLRQMITAAMAEFHAKTPVKWIEVDQDCAYFVEFFQNNEKCPHATVGCYYEQGGDQQKISCPYPKYPGGTLLQHICVLHEMCHCIGLAHEHSRSDRDEHVHIQCDTVDHNYAKRGVRFGNYDYYSIMHYGHGAGPLQCKSEELRKRADKGTTFSAGDLAVIRKLYNGRTGHHGDWHDACRGAGCTDTSCECGACGPLHGGVNCGYSGRKGHWTCCMKEDFNSICDSTHTGFWHAPCEPGCSDAMCRCNNCGGGCKYKGSKGHWSCCNLEGFHSICLHCPFPRDS